MWGWFSALSLGRKVLVGLSSFIAVGAAGSAISPPSNTIPPPPTTQNNNHAVKSDNIQVKTETETKSVPFQTTTQNDSGLASGTTKIVTQGVNGVETITYKVTYTNGIETSRDKISDEITTKPVDQVTAIGVYVTPAQNCSNGTYVNSAGNTVCSPYSAPSTPTGATAQCLDGTYSFSQSRSGTCSHHGGVATWL
jgi:resuscitation-promoting factor RpfB